MSPERDVARAVAQRGAMSDKLVDRYLPCADRLDDVLKVERVALRLPISIISRLWNSGSEKVMSSWTTLTMTMTPPCATYAKADCIERLFPVAS